jgi:hypothetical protein
VSIVHADHRFGKRIDVSPLGISKTGALTSCRAIWDAPLAQTRETNPRIDAIDVIKTARSASSSVEQEHAQRCAEQANREGHTDKSLQERAYGKQGPLWICAGFCRSAMDGYGYPMPRRRSA